MFRNRSANTHKFAMIPSSEVPRSSMRIQHTHKTTFDAGYLIPVYVDEILPGDTFKVNMTCFARLATPIAPIMDNIWLDSFFFFVPWRLVWANSRKFFGEQDNPDDVVEYEIPQMTSPPTGYPHLSIYDYMGLPTEGDLAAAVVHQSLPLRAYNLIWKEWFRDENLQDSPVIHTGQGVDPVADYQLLRRNKRYDYMTGCLPFVQKGESVGIPLGTTAPVMTGATEHDTTGWSQTKLKTNTNTSLSSLQNLNMNSDNSLSNGSATGLAAGAQAMVFSNLYADLTEATSATINQLRQAIAIQQLLEKKARGGTRYTEYVQQMFKVRSPDARLQRPEYLGGGTTPVHINPVVQTAASPDTGAPYNTPQGNLAAIGTALLQEHAFEQSFTEHGIIIGLISVRADMTYQQGIRRMWNRTSEYEVYVPAFANLGEQMVQNREIYAQGTNVDLEAFGYQERWAEYRYHPSRVSGLFRSSAPSTIDFWHLSQNFTTLPTLSTDFIEENPPIERIVAVGAAAAGQQFIADIAFDAIAARPMPMYSVPGLNRL